MPAYYEASIIVTRPPGQSTWEEDTEFGVNVSIPWEAPSAGLSEALRSARIELEKKLKTEITTAIQDLLAGIAKGCPAYDATVRSRVRQVSQSVLSEVPLKTYGVDLKSVSVPTQRASSAPSGTSAG